MNKVKEKNSSKLISWQPCKTARLLHTSAEGSPNDCSKIMPWSHRYQKNPGELCPSPATWFDVLDPQPLPNHLVNVEKGKPEWFMLRSNGGGDQDFRFISRTSALHCHWTPVPAGTDHATGTKPPALYNYFYSVFPDFQSFCCAISDYSILQGFTEEAK